MITGLGMMMEGGHTLTGRLTGDRPCSLCGRLVPLNTLDIPFTPTHVLRSALVGVSGLYPEGARAGSTLPSSVGNSIFLRGVMLMKGETVALDASTHVELGGFRGLRR